MSDFDPALFVEGKKEGTSTVKQAGRADSGGKDAAEPDAKAKAGTSAVESTESGNSGISTVKPAGRLEEP